MILNTICILLSIGCPLACGVMGFVASTRPQQGKARQGFEISFATLAVVGALSAGWLAFDNNRTQDKLNGRIQKLSSDDKSYFRELAVELSRIEPSRPIIGSNPRGSVLAPAPMPPPKVPSEKISTATLVKLTQLTAEGGAINKQWFDHKMDTQGFLKESDDWARRSIDFLGAINPVYALRFAGAHPDYTVVSNPDHDLEGANRYNKNLANIDVLVDVAKRLDHED